MCAALTSREQYNMIAETSQAYTLDAIRTLGSMSVY